MSIERRKKERENLTDEDKLELSNHATRQNLSRKIFFLHV